MNGEVDLGSIGTPATAKNCITVGACESLRPGFGRVDPQGYEHRTYGGTWGAFRRNPIFSDQIANDCEGLAAFSGRGPTSDHRIKPDLVAPGTGILSAHSRAHSGQVFAPSKDPLCYYFDCGTSMATPFVAGCAAVVREWLRKKGIARPSAALVKALLINGADPLRGQYAPSETGSVPNSHQGFGRVNLAASIGALPKTLLEFWDEGPALDTDGGGELHRAARSGCSGREGHLGLDRRAR